MSLAKKEGNVGIMKKITLFTKKSQVEKMFSQSHLERLGSLGSLHIYDRDDYDDRKYILDFIKDSELIVTAWGSSKLDDEMVELCPNLRAVIHAGGAVKQLLSDTIIKNNIIVSTANGELADGVAESTLAIAVAACKGMFFLAEDTRNGLWAENRERVKDFYDITVGIVSAGAIGRRVIKLLQNYQVDVLAYDPYLSAEQIAEFGAKKCDFKELISQSDVISIHTPSIPETDNLFNSETIPLIKDGAVVINTARPNVIDDDAFVKELAKNRFTAVLDVVRKEPDADHPYRKLPNVVLLPHVAGAVTNGCKRMGKFAVEEAERLCSEKRYWDRSIYQNCL